MAWAFVAKTEPSLRSRAMRFLARREHSRAELARKLAPIAAEGEGVEALLDELATKGWLSDARYAELAVRSRARRFGPLKVAHQLRVKGVGEETITLLSRPRASTAPRTSRKCGGADSPSRPRTIGSVAGRCGSCKAAAFPSRTSCVS